MPLEKNKLLTTMMLGIFVVLMVMMVLANIVIRNSMDSSTSTPPTQDLKKIQTQTLESAIPQTGIIPDGMSILENVAGDEKNKSSAPGKPFPEDSKEIIYEPSIKDNILLQ